MLHKVMLFLFFCLLALGVTYGYYYSRWKWIWKLQIPCHIIPFLIFRTMFFALFRQE